MCRNFCMLVLACWAGYSLAQQISDDDFRFPNPAPAFAAAAGPRVCIDEGHYNFHTAEGRYKPFANLVREDGYRVVRFSEQFSESALQQCDVMVIANALAEENETDWRYPHYSAFDGDELRAMKVWIQGGGSLLLFADHAPNAGAARELGAVLGVIMTDVYAVNDPDEPPDRFRLEDGTLHAHPIQIGRNAEESVDAVMTFTGQPAQITDGWVPLLTFGTEAIAFISPQQTYEQASQTRPPSFPVSGWIHGAARQFDDGRIVFLGEAAMCSAQLGGPTRTPMGMNSPEAAQNPQFCLNAIRWLTGVLN